MAVAGLGLPGCGPGPARVDVVDLVAEFRYAEVERERPLIDLGSPSAAGALAGGWSWNETDPRGASFVWAVGPRSEVRVFLAWARDLEVCMRCRAYRYPDAPAQVVTFLWDDAEVASLELKAGFMEVGLVVPAELATPGSHRLALVPTYFGRPEKTGDAGPPPRHPRKLSIACDWIALGDGPAAGAARGEGETLWIPASTEVSFFLEPEHDLELQWESSALRRVSSLDVVWEVEGAAPVTGSITRESAPPLRLPVPPAGNRGANAAGDDGLAGTAPVRPTRLALRAAGRDLVSGGDRTVPTSLSDLGIVRSRRAGDGSPAGGEDASGGEVASGAEDWGAVLRRPRLTAAAHVMQRGVELTDRAADETPLDDSAAAADYRVRHEPRQHAVVSGLPSSGGERVPASILLWIVDTLRVDRLGFHGHEREVSPNFDALAERSTVFERAIAQSSWTRPTVATLLTGVGPERHGIRELSHGMQESFATLPERLKELGYATAGFSANANVTADTGFAQGFDRFEYAAVDVDELVEQALAWLDELVARSPAQPFFLMILSVEPHAAFAPAEPFRSRFAAGVADPELGSVTHLRALSSKEASSGPDIVEQLFQLYDAEIAWNDHVFGEFRRELDERGRDPLVVVVADHGEAFEERGVFGHAWDLHREVLDIPFFIHRPGQVEGRRVPAAVQQADLLPTLIEIAGGEPVTAIEGDSLAPLLGPDADTAADGSRALADRLLLSTMDTFRRPAASLVRGRYKLIELRRPGRAPSRQLFDRVADPEESRNLADERPLLAGRLARLLRERLDLAAQDGVEATPVELDADTRRRLEALGYIE